MSKPLKILFLTYDLFYPLVSGGKIRAYYLIKNLARKHQITLFSYYRDENQKQYLTEIKKYCPKVFLFKRRKPWSWQNLLRSFLTPLPFASATYYSRDLKRALIKELKKNQYDLVHFESFYPALYLPLVKRLGVKTVMGNENLEYQVYARYASSRRFFLFRQLLKLEVWRMRLYEQRLWQLADVNLAPSGGEAKVIEKITKKDCSIIPNGVDPGVFSQVKYREKAKTLIFVGTLIYQANDDAMKYFFKEIHPEIKKQKEEVEFILLSWYQPDWLKKYLAGQSVKLIKDKKTAVAEFLVKADVLVAPMRIAGGTNIKVLEAMAAGLPVVTTSIGIEGIKAKKGKEVIVADNPKNFAGETVKLLINRKRRQKLGLAGKALVKRLYNWTKITKKLEKAYQELGRQ